MSIKYSEEYERKRYKEPKKFKRENYLRPDEIHLLFNLENGIIPRGRDWIMFSLGTFVGLRPIEIVGGEPKYMVKSQMNPGKMAEAESEKPGVWINDINFETNLLRVHGKGDKERHVPMPDFVMNEINLYLKDDEEHLYPQRKRMKPGQNYRLICRKKTLNKGISTDNMRKLFSVYRDKAEINRKITPHSLRHTYAMEFLRLGGTINALMENLGHTRIQSTMQYLHAMKSEDRAKESKKVMAFSPVLG